MSCRRNFLIRHGSSLDFQPTSRSENVFEKISWRDEYDGGGRTGVPAAGPVCPCSRPLGDRAGQPFEHGSNVCPGVSRTSRQLQASELHVRSITCPESPRSCGTRAHPPSATTYAP